MAAFGDISSSTTPSTTQFRFGAHWLENSPIDCGRICFVLYLPPSTLAGCQSGHFLGFGGRVDGYRLKLRGRRRLYDQGLGCISRGPQVLPFSCFVFFVASLVYSLWCHDAGSFQGTAGGMSGVGYYVYNSSAEFASPEVFLMITVYMEVRTGE